MAGPPFDQGADPELEEILRGDTELLDLSRRLRASRPDPQVGPHFRAYLRARIMDAADTELRPRGLRRLLPRPGALAWGGAGLGVAMIGAVVLTLVLSHPADQINVVSANSQIDGKGNIDPNDVIRISFTQAMDHGSVESGLHIQPATAVTKQWDGNTLVLTPVNKLSGNTPYSVTIAKGAARATNGTVAASDIHITFGTHPAPTPVPSPSPAGPPALVLHPVGAADRGAQLVLAADGSLLVTSAPPAASQATPTPSTQVTSAGSGLVRVAPDGSTSRIGDAVTGAALSPGDRSLALLGPVSGGRYPVEVANADGSHLTQLTTTDLAATPLAWGGDDLHPVILFVGDGQLRLVDLQGRVRTVAGHHSVAAGMPVAFSADGRYAYVGPLAPAAVASPNPSPTPTPVSTPAAPVGGQLVDTRTGDSPTLANSASVVAFSRDGSRVLWVDAGSGALLSAPTAGGNITSVPVAGSGTGVTLGSLQADSTGSRAAFLLSRSDGSRELRVVAVPSGTTLATANGQGLARIVLSAAGDRLAALRTDASGTVAELAGAPTSVPGASLTPPGVPAEAAGLVSKLVDGQVSNNLGALSFVAPSVTQHLAQVTPQGLSRGYIVRVERVSGSPTAVTAAIRLIRDPSKTNPVLFSDETVTLERSAADTPYLVTEVSATPLQPEPVGPQIVHVDSSGDPLSTVLRITFDSDLRADSVAPAIAVLNAEGKQVTTTVSYDMASRVATVTVSGQRPLTLTVATSLLDVDSQRLATVFTTTLDD